MIRSLEGKIFWDKNTHIRSSLCGVNDRQEIPTGCLKEEGPGEVCGTGNSERNKMTARLTPPTRAGHAEDLRVWLPRARSHVTLPACAASEPAVMAPIPRAAVLNQTL